MKRSSAASKVQEEKKANVEAKCEAVAQKITVYGLWSQFCDELDFQYHGITGKVYHFKCRECGGYSIHFDISTLKWVCLCKPALKYPRSNWQSLFLYQVAPRKIPDAIGFILESADSLISEYETKAAEQKKAADLRMRNYGVYLINTAEQTKVPKKKSGRPRKVLKGAK